MTDRMTLNETVREALGIALIQIMEEKPFHDITIREIASLAGVSRSSFYRNFSTKEELLNKYIASLYRAFLETPGVPRSISSTMQIQDFLKPRFRFIKEHRNIYRVLYRNNLLYSFFQQSEQELIQLLCGPDEVFSPYHCAMLSGACAGVIRCWIERDFTDDEQTMAMLFSDPFQYILRIKELGSESHGGPFHTAP